MEINFPNEIVKEIVQFLPKTLINPLAKSPTVFGKLCRNELYKRVVADDFENSSELQTFIDETDFDLDTLLLLSSDELDPEFDYDQFKSVSINQVHKDLPDLNYDYLCILKGVKIPPRVRELTLYDTENLTGNFDLKSLILNNSSIPLAHLQKYQSLENLEVNAASSERFNVSLPNLKSLTIHNDDNNGLSHLPKLKKLEIYEVKSLDFVPPVEHLTIIDGVGLTHIKQIESIRLKSLKLILYCLWESEEFYATKFPESLETLEIYIDAGPELPFISCLNQLNLPRNLKKFCIINAYELQISSLTLPPDLEYLEFRYIEKVHRSFVFPPNLKTLVMYGIPFDESTLPASLQSLTLVGCTNRGNFDHLKRLKHFEVSNNQISPESGPDNESDSYRGSFYEDGDRGFDSDGGVNRGFTELEIQDEYEEQYEDE